jgi:hypothetical protein
MMFLNWECPAIGASVQAGRAKLAGNAG